MLDHPNLTKNQALVLGTLSGSEGPLTAYAILDDLRDSGFRAPLQVYRALEKLIDYGLVHRLESLNAFVACRHNECGTHQTAAFTICNDCGKVTEFAPDEAMEQLRSWTKAHGFRLSQATIELRGDCEACAAQG